MLNSIVISLAVFSIIFLGSMEDLIRNNSHILLY
jgi:hypothetical protein